MQKRTRRILFYISVLVFAVASYVTVMYAQGYKYSFSEHKFLRSGAIFLKTNTDAKIFLDDKLVDSTSFLGNDAGINHLLPGQFTVRLQRDGYSAWQKLITVEQGRVSEFTRILLLPQSEDEISKLASEALDALSGQKVVLAPTPTPKPRKPVPSVSPAPSPEPFFIKSKTMFQTVDGTPRELAKDVLGFSLSGDDNKLLFWTAHELWVLWLNSTDYQPYKNRGDKAMVTRLSTIIKRAAWFRDEDHVVVDANGYKVIELDSRGGTNIIKI